MNFQGKLNAAIAKNSSLLCVGLDPQKRLMPEDVNVVDFINRIVDATRDLVCAYKPNVAFYDLIKGGHEMLDDILDHIRDVAPGVAIIGDSKRGDVADTALIHAQVMFERFGFDAATINPLPGREGGVDAFLRYEQKGVFVWSRSSNPGSKDLFDGWFEQPDGPLNVGRVRFYEYISLLANEWNKDHGNVGLVAVATYPEELKRQRELCPDLPFLIPGIGAQQGDLEKTVVYGTDANGLNATINASRSILYGSLQGPIRDAANFDVEARAVALSMHKHIMHQLEIGMKEAPTLV